MEDLPNEVIGHTLRYASSWKDVVAAAGVCKHWRRATKDAAQWQVLGGGGEAETGVLVETFDGFEWSDFETLRDAEGSNLCARGAQSEAGTPGPRQQSATQTELSQQCSPKTPSPERTILVAKTRETLVGKVIPQLEALGHLLASVSVNSFSLDDGKLQSILGSCPNLRRLVVSHVCAKKIERATRSLSVLSPIEDNSASPIKIAGQISEESRSQHVKSTKCIDECGCARLTGSGFANLSTFCPFLERVELVLHHVFHPRDLEGILSALAQQMPKVSELTIKLVEPDELKCQSLKKHYEWLDHQFFTQEHLEILGGWGEGGRVCSALEHLYLEPWTVSEDSLGFCARAFPKLKSLRVANPTFCRIDGTLGGGVDGCESLSHFRGLQTLQISQARNFDKLLEALGVPDFTGTLNHIELDLYSSLEETQVRQLQEKCKDLESLFLSYFAESTNGRMQWQRQREWRHGIEVLY
ncbi:F-box domain-containing protein [Chloropicon primus]|uniref:F-box domain-containing protein n=2 Tax=Chloropicon primus TaxID=1764295 RepID=A0A5B8MN64_9CHLO|nr:hypothetical protein A3770_04p32900 [Chloropicon primus]UPQ99984.1 F-box domain-containing protein [Chloropicon primus]|eukprot:QDZ20772.1 hypothetical protein A3770_04p32900 [Chloropicon primus]